MVHSVIEAEQYAAQWEELRTDKERLDFVIMNKDHIMLHLDNDCTSIGFIADQELPEETLDAITDVEADTSPFDDYAGWSDLVVLVFSSLGVRAEAV